MPLRTVLTTSETQSVVDLIPAIVSKDQSQSIYVCSHLTNRTFKLCRRWIGRIIVAGRPATVTWLLQHDSAQFAKTGNLLETPGAGTQDWRNI